MAHQSDEFAILNVEVDAFENMGAVVGLFDIRDVQFSHDVPMHDLS